MRLKNNYSPHWTWWIRAGQRLELGLDVRLVLRPAGQGMPASVEKGLARVRDGVAEGRIIVASMRDSGMRLPVEAWSLLAAGEQTGKLAEAMGKTGKLLREQGVRRRALIGYLWYPAMVLGVGVLVMGLILFWVVPQMREVSISMGFGEELPWLTEHIGQLYGFAMLFLVLAGLLVFAGALGLRIASRHHERWAGVAEQIYRLVPGFGRIRQLLREARLARQLGTLLQAGITLPQALQMTAQDARDRWERDQLDLCRERLLMGIGFREVLAAFPLLSREYLPLLESGQESGQLEVFLFQIADDRDEDILRQFSVWTRFLEPGVLLFLSIAIGGLILAYLLPMVNMLERLA
ncbi:MAG: type II secretion system F family protein [Puniceicoccaceae bacterium]